MPTKARNRILAAVRELAALPSLSASPATVDHVLERLCSAGAQVTFAKLGPGSEVRIEVALEVGLTVHDFIPLFATCPGATFTNPVGAPQPYCLALRVPPGELRITCPTLESRRVRQIVVSEVARVDWEADAAARAGPTPLNVPAWWELLDA